MAYLISEMGAQLLADVENFCKREVLPNCAAWDRDGVVPEETIHLMAEMGYQTLIMPEELGGLGLASVDIAAILEKVAYADAGFAVTLAGNNLALRAVLSRGTALQKVRVCDMLLNGGLGAFCLTESQAGSDASAVATEAVKQENGDYILNGTKLFITNGSIADFYCVAAKIKGQEKLSVFLIEKGTPGLSSGVHEHKLGIRSSDTCQVILDNCRVSSDALLGGAEGKGMSALLAALNEGRLWVAAMALGVAQRALDEAISYGKERYQFGKPVTDQQAIRFKLAKMQTRIEAARQLIAYGLQMMDRGDDFAKEAAMAKAFAAEVAVEVTGEAMDIFGGYGFIQEYPIEKLLRDARVFPIIEGTAEMQNQLIAAVLLGKERG